MIKKTITWTDFNDVEHTEDFYFHLTKMRLLELAGDGTLQAKLQAMVAAQDNVQILRKITEVVTLAVGRRSDDGSRFIQNAEITEEITSSPAFDEILVWLMSDVNEAANFIKRLIPKDMQKEMEKEMEKNPDPFKNPPNPISNVGTPMGEIDARPDWEREGRMPTSKELSVMSEAEKNRFMQLLQDDKLDK